METNIQISNELLEKVWDALYINDAISPGERVAIMDILIKEKQRLSAEA